MAAFFSIYDEQSNKLLAAHVVVYKGTPDQYDTFISPEAWTVYEQYSNPRIKFGENITETQLLFWCTYNGIVLSTC
jgi:hypothetical protein